MRNRKIFVVAALVALSLGLLATGGALAWMWVKVRTFERDHGARVFANLEKSQLDARVRLAVREKAARTNAAERTASPAQSSEMRVIRTEYDGDRTLSITLSQRPEMEVVRNYLAVEPMASGTCSVRYVTPRRDGEFRSVLVVTGDYAHRTNVTLRLRKGLPRYGKGANPADAGALAADYSYTFRRKDRAPYVNFADLGRYLPPSGRNSVTFESINVSNITVSVCRVEPRNVVQLLAREEGRYARQQWPRSVDREETAELAGAAVTRTLVTSNRVNEVERTRVSVAVPDGKGARGIYLVQALRAGWERQEWVWNDEDSEKLNPLRCRLVCISDLGLSVRKSGADGLGVWVTSLLRGTPVQDAVVEVYSSANTRVMEGVADANGWCEPKRIDAGEPFAVVVYAADSHDMTFMALSPAMSVDETQPDGGREDYLLPQAIEAFVWTERGIYRHGEQIFAQTIVRNGRRRAPAALPVELCLVKPDGTPYATVTRKTDAEGTFVHRDFTVPDEQPSGVWTLKAKVPGKNGRVLGRRAIKVEEFAPPQIRVAVAARQDVHPTNFAFTVSAEHLFGGPAAGLRCEGAVVFEDIPFAPAAWKGWHFGNEDRGFKPSFRTLPGTKLDADGRVTLAAPVWADSGLPKAAVRATGQGVVFEDGGRPATARQRVNLHYYPYYIGARLGTSLKLESGVRPRVAFACVRPDGSRLGVEKRLRAKIERVDCVYAYQTKNDGWQTWDCERIRVTLATNLALTVSAAADGVLELPLDKGGDYVLTVDDPETSVSYAHAFYLNDWADDVVRAPLANPTAVTVVPDKAFYRVGERPRLLVKSPFAGSALLTAQRDRQVYAEVHALTNATSELVLRPVTDADAPNLDLYISVVQRVAANARHMAVRAHGQTTLRVRPVADEIPVALGVRLADLRTVDVTLAAPGATAAYVTVVDEGINLLTDEPVPDPVGRFAAVRSAMHPLYDLYSRILPVQDGDGLGVNGVKTGGGFGAEMLGRVSPVPTRRFKPLARWSERVPVVRGAAHVQIAIPEFAGELRVTAVAWSATATGAAAVRQKVSPKVVMMPDAPRFVAPGDDYEISLPIYNKGGAAGAIAYELADGKGVVRLAAGAATNLVRRLKAPSEPGAVTLVYRARGFGEEHEKTIRLPVRPAVAARETAGVTCARDWIAPTSGVWSAQTFDSPIGELSQALGWLARYPHGCLEQTVSRVFPLLAAGGILTTVSSNGADCVEAGVRRVESMVRSRDFVMWPDCDYAPWDREVSLYAAHFLVAAERGGVRSNPVARERVLKFLSRWALGTNTAVSAYACQTLALAGVPDRDRMLALYDARAKLSLLSRARLARAFVRVADRARAETLLATHYAPGSVKEAAFVLLALLDLNPDDERVLPLVRHLNANRDRTTFTWGTTASNAHALIALGAYYRHRPPKPGERFVAWRKLTLPELADVRATSNGLVLARSIRTADGKPADLNALRRGALLQIELELTASDARTFADLVIQDLFAGAFEPVLDSLAAEEPADGQTSVDWVMRHDARDDRMLVFSKRFALGKGEKVVFRYPVRVVSAGDYVLPGTTVEAMYHPELSASCAPDRISVR